MAALVSKIDDLISNCQARLDEANQKLDKAQQRLDEAHDAVRQLEAELRGLRSARESVGGLPARQRSTAVRARGLSSTWRSILQFVGSKGDAGVTIDDIQSFVDGQNLDIQRGAIRSQLSLYKQREMLETIGDAQYKLTAQGDAFLKEPEEH